MFVSSRLENALSIDKTYILLPYVFFYSAGKIADNNNVSGLALSPCETRDTVFIR